MMHHGAKINWEDSEPEEDDELVTGVEGVAWTKKECVAHEKT